AGRQAPPARACVRHEAAALSRFVNGELSMAPRRPTDIPRTPDSPPTTPAPALRKARTAIPPVLQPAVTPEERRALIAEKAYLLPDRGGVAGGGETEDWLAAETEVAVLLRISRGAPPQ